MEAASAEAGRVGMKAAFRHRSGAMDEPQYQSVERGEAFAPPAWKDAVLPWWPFLLCLIYPPVQRSPIGRAYKQPVGEGDYRRYRAPLVLRNKLTAQSKCCPLSRDDDGPHRCTRNKRHGKTDKRETRGQVPREGRPTCRSLSSEGGCMG